MCPVVFNTDFIEPDWNAVSILPSGIILPVTHGHIADHKKRSYGLPLPNGLTSFSRLTA